MIEGTSCSARCCFFWATEIVEDTGTRGHFWMRSEGASEIMDSTWGFYFNFFIGSQYEKTYRNLLFQFLFKKIEIFRLQIKYKNSVQLQYDRRTKRDDI